MMRYAGIVVGSDSAIIVDATVEKDGPITIIADHTIRLQKGAKPAAYSQFRDELVNYVREQGIEAAIIKGSALTQGSTKQAHLDAAELRGVAIAAAASVVGTQIAKKAALSKSFGERKIDEYLSDNDFWGEQLSDDSHTIRKGSREAAILILANRPK